MVTSLLFVVGVLLYLISQSGIVLPGEDPLSSYVSRILLAGFTIMVLLYLWDQRQRLRAEVRLKTEGLDRAVRWLSLSNNSASILAQRGTKDGLVEVLGGIAELLGADAAAVLGRDEHYVYKEDRQSAEEVDRLLMHVTIEAVGHPDPLRINSLGDEAGEAIAIPLRVDGALRFVLCAWRSGDTFHDEEIDALGLAGRMIELAIEREESVQEAHDQLDGTLGVLQYLGADRSSNYAAHAALIASLASDVGERMGLTPRQCKDLRMAGLIHDIGLMSLPSEISSRPVSELSHEESLIHEQHPRIGEEIARAAHFGEEIQQAIRWHHELVDGNGYRLNAAGHRLPLPARILAVCEACENAATLIETGDVQTRRLAFEELARRKASRLDPPVMRALIETLKERVKMDSSPKESEPMLASTPSAEDEEWLLLEALTRDCIEPATTTVFELPVQLVSSSSGS